MDCLFAEPLSRRIAKRDEDRHNHDLRGHKRRLGLRRHHRFEGRHLLEELKYQDGTIKVEGNGGADHVGPPAAAGELAAVARENRYRQHHQRYGTDYVGRLKPLEGKEEPSDARQYGRDQKERRPAIKPFRGEQPERDHQPRQNPYQAYRDVDEVNVVIPKIMMCLLSESADVTTIAAQISSTPAQRR